MSKITFVVALKEFNEIKRGKQTSIFREPSENLMKRLEKDYDLLEIRNGVMSNRPKIFYKFLGFDRVEEGYVIYFGKKVGEENMKDELKLIWDKLCK